MKRIRISHHYYLVACHNALIMHHESRQSDFQMTSLKKINSIPLLFNKIYKKNNNIIVINILAAG